MSPSSLRAALKGNLRDGPLALVENVVLYMIVRANVLILWGRIVILLQLKGDTNMWGLATALRFFLKRKK